MIDITHYHHGFLTANLLTRMETNSPHISQTESFAIYPRGLVWRSVLFSTSLDDLDAPLDPFWLEDNQVSDTIYNFMP